MEFNSFSFALFIIPTLLIYGFLTHKRQNLFLLIASYYFYGSWDWRFLGLILASTLVDYYCGTQIGKQPERKKRFLYLSLFFNLGTLGLFKYCNFFIDSLLCSFEAIGVNLSIPFVEIILPVGISFYTFQTLSYTIDVYRGDTPPCKSFLDFALYVSFFPQLVAGPIEKSHHFLPQIIKKRTPTLEGFYEGTWLIFWGLYKKVFIADNCAKIVERIYHSGPLEDQTGFNLLIGAYAFTWQIYCDFSGYSDIARGLSKIMGFDLILNFKQPLLSHNVQDFWRKWHISLSEWFRDYLYYPLGGSKCPKFDCCRNVFIVFVISGVWHGAHIKYLLWGALHGIALVGLISTEGFFKKLQSLVPKGLYKFLSILVTFHFVAITFAIWQTQDFNEFLIVIQKIFTDFTTTSKSFMFLGKVFGFIALLLTIQIWQRVKKDSFVIAKSPIALRLLIYAIMLFCIMRFGIFQGSQFIYFQF